jgi:uncharacterized protein affecting Mg2+/Co2+ transport
MDTQPHGRFDLTARSRIAAEPLLPHTGSHVSATALAIRDAGYLRPQSASHPWAKRDVDGRAEPVHGAGVIGVHPVHAPCAQPIPMGGALLSSSMRRLRPAPCRFHAARFSL